MTSLYILIGIVAFFVITLTAWNAMQRKKGNQVENKPREPEINVECCGQHEVCERDSLIAAFTDKPEYFDDEELDDYRGQDASAYSEAQAEEFRSVFYTILDEEKPRWIRSLQLRGIALPNQVKDEVLMIINDLRNHKSHA